MVLEVDGANEAARGVVRFGRLVDVDARQDFRGILVELDGAAVAGRGLLTAVEKSGRVSGPKPRIEIMLARPLLRWEATPGRRAMASPIDVIGQFADVFGGDRFDDWFPNLLLALRFAAKLESRSRRSAGAGSARGFAAVSLGGGVVGCAAAVAALASPVMTGWAVVDGVLGPGRASGTVIAMGLPQLQDASA